MIIYSAVILVVIASLIYYLSNALRRKYNAEVREGLYRVKNMEESVLTEKDIAHLPEPVQKYLKYVGVLGKEKVKDFKVLINGTMKTDKNREWSQVKIGQHSFLDKITRLFYLNLNMSGIPVLGLHFYKNGIATMEIKVLGLIPIVEGMGKKMNQAETVTVFNDMCIMAPASLIDKRIQWEPVDSHSVKAIFCNDGNCITVTLYFNDIGQLTNFVSDDRYYSPTGKTFESVRWSTPVSSYKNINGFNLVTYGEAIWNFPDGDFCYAKFNIQDIKYNYNND
ncbi:DUF6544 family protein [Anaerocolumna aminovalerica]|uniref:DUF6544 family protein n=1 Tax=Anaerocolumna aminovalerica TaxID=1527 RepID=UPI00248B6D12|nr:DUF6544 family protein [Anaerocolumna aminovalerica]